MCLAIPGKIVSINHETEEVFRTGKVSFDGIQREVNLSMLPEAVEGDYVLVHVGVALNTIAEDEANKVFKFLKEAGELDELGSDD